MRYTSINYKTPVVMGDFNANFQNYIKNKVIGEWNNGMNTLSYVEKDKNKNSETP